MSPGGTNSQTPMFPTVGKWAVVLQVMEPAIIETDARSRAVIPGQPNARFLMRVNEDGSILLQPARVVTEAQHEYDSTPELRELLSRAAGSATVRRSRAKRT